jgi:hypothetical protein
MSVFLTTFVDDFSRRFRLRPRLYFANPVSFAPRMESRILVRQDFKSTDIHPPKPSESTMIPKAKQPAVS